MGFPGSITATSRPPAEGIAHGSVTYTHPPTALPAGPIEIYIQHVGTFGGTLMVDDVRLYETPIDDSADHPFGHFESYAAGHVLASGGLEKFSAGLVSGSQMIVPG